jgi:HEAT repeat protein
MTRRRSLLAALAALALTAAAGLSVREAPDATTPPAARAQSSAPGACPPGEVRTYALTLQTEQTAQMLDAPQTGRLDLAATVELRCHEAQVVGLRFTDLQRHALTMLGQAVLTDAEAARAALVGPEALATLSPLGALESLQPPEGVDPLFRHLARAVLAEIQVVTDADPEAATWRVEEVTPLGRATVDYTRLPASPGSDLVALEKVRAGYVRLDALPLGTAADRVETGGALVARLRDGRLDSLLGDETLSALAADGRAVLEARTQLSLKLVDVGRFDPRADAATLAARPRVSADGPDASPALERRLLEARVDGLTMESLVDTVLEFGDGGTMPDHNRWLWRATGLLTLHPERCAELVAMFGDPNLTPAARGLLADLLANAGHPQAQAALRRMLDDDAARRDAAGPALLQRAALLESPTAETLDWAIARMDQDEGALGEAALVTVGALVGQRALQGDTEGAADANSRLLSRLESAKTPRARELAVLALGNAGLPQNLPRLAALARDPEPDVRSAVATALRKTPTDEARGTLIGLLTDADDEVQRAAGRGVARQTLDADALAVIAAGVATGEIRPAAWPGLLTALSAMPGDAGARAVLGAMLRVPGLDPMLAERIRGLIQA